MKLNKIIFTLLAVLIINFGASDANAQFGGLGKKIIKKAKEKVEKTKTETPKTDSKTENTNVETAKTDVSGESESEESEPQDGKVQVHITDVVQCEEDVHVVYENDGGKTAHTFTANGIGIYLRLKPGAKIWYSDGEASYTPTTLLYTVTNAKEQTVKLCGE